MAVEKQPHNGQITSTDSLLLSRQECNLMRGLAILLIITDNFTHLFNGVFLDNEFNFMWSSVEGVLNNLSHPNKLLPYNLLAFYCPYGVMLFTFISGYCLTLKYEKGDGQGTSCKDFIVRHYNKLFSMQFKGLTIFLIVLLLFNHHIIVEYPILLQAFLVGNLHPNAIIIPTPYWFFGMIMEMYVIYRLIIYRRRDGIAIALTVLSLMVMAFTDPEGNLLRNLRYNCFIAILPFCMGVLAARHLNHKSLKIDKTAACLGWFVLSFILLTLSKFNFYSWLVMPVFVVTSALAIVKLIAKVRLFDNIFGWLGALSGVLFVVHPTVRMLLIPRANESGAFAITLLAYLFITFGLSIMLKPLFTHKQ